MGGILAEADIFTVLTVLIDEIEYRISVKEIKSRARAEIIPTAETEVAEMPRLISAEHKATMQHY